tara:strand:- start:6575 stop:8119 length:1545 start_codon:yes stop_codon:yes gene_type:complete
MAISDKLVAAAMKNLEKLLISKGLNAEGMISKFDFDGDGQINIDEFDNGLAELTGSRAPRSYLQPIFSAIDQDGSGKLSSNELMALLGIENETVYSSSSLIISDHVNEKYNGEYRIQSSQMNGKDWYLNSNNCRLYFYNANDGGAPSWSLDDRDQDGSNDWYAGGWTRVPADGNIPVGTRRFVGAGKITISAVEGVEEPTESFETSEDEKTNGDEGTLVNRMTFELTESLTNSTSEEEINAVKAVMDDRFESELNLLPQVARPPIRALWDIKSDAVISVAKTKLSNDNAKIVTGLGLAGAAIGAISSINQNIRSNNDDVELMPQNERPLEQNQDITEPAENSSGNLRVEVPDRVDLPEQISSNQWAEENEVEVPEKVELPERVSVSEPISESFNEVDSEDKILQNSDFSLDEIIDKMKEARFLNEQRELISSFKGEVFNVSFKVKSVDRTFGIGVSDDYRRGNTLHVISGNNELEIRMKNDFDTSGISSGQEKSLQVSVADWNGIRKRLVMQSI